MEKINIVYIDDNLDISLSRYLEEYSHKECEFESIDIKFCSEDGYESLINNPNVRSANIIFIDSRLFENRTANQGKFTGEEFKIILKKYFPFIEVIVITQNEIAKGYETIAKYDPREEEPAEQYYGKIIPGIMEIAIKNICELRKIASDMKKNKKWEDVLIDKITNSLNGCGSYDELTKKDIDEVISVFKEIQEKIDG